MKSPVLFALPALLLPAVVFSSPVDAALVAAVRLADQPNYSWTTAVDDDAGSYEIQGKTVKDSLTWIRMPTTRGVAIRLGPDADSDMQLLFRDPVRFVILTPRGWKKFDELPPPPDEDFDAEDSEFSMMVVNGLLMPAPSARRSFPSARLYEDAGAWRYRDASLALNLPHQELGVIVSSGCAFTPDGDGIAGQLTELGARLLLVREGQREVLPLRAEGSFKLWTRNGVLVRYRVRLHGLVKIRRQVVEVRQLTTTAITDIGHAGFFVAHDALKKLFR
jgi:hypothetical protein